MSSLTFHAAQGIVTSAALYPFLGDNVLPFGLATVFIDLDHVVAYIHDTGCFDLRGLFTYAKLTECNLKRRFLVLSVFHTVECFAFVALLAWFHPMVWYVLAGMLYHLAADIVNLIMLGYPYGRAYSLVEYRIRSKRPDTVTSLRVMLQRPDAIIEGVRGAAQWRHRWLNGWCCIGRNGCGTNWTQLRKTKQDRLGHEGCD